MGWGGQSATHPKRGSSGNGSEIRNGGESQPSTFMSQGRGAYLDNLTVKYLWTNISASAGKVELGQKFSGKL